MISKRDEHRNFVVGRAALDHGNGVACVVISRSEGELDKDRLHETMAHPIEIGEALEPGAR